MGCISSSKAVKSSTSVIAPEKPTKENSSLSKKLILAIQTGNLKVVKQLVNHANLETIDLSSI